MLSKFRNLNPQGSILSELIDIDRGVYIVKVSIQLNGITLATGLAGAEDVEKAEDSARNRALQALVSEDGHLSLNLATKADQEIATPITATTETSNHHDALPAKSSSDQEIPLLPERESPIKSTTEVAPEKIVTATVQSPIPAPPTITSLLNEPAVNQTPELDSAAISTPVSPEIATPSAEYQEEILESPLESTTAPDELLQAETSWTENLPEPPATSEKKPRQEKQSTTLIPPETQQAVAEPLVTEAPVEFDFNQIRHKIDLEMKRLSWTKEQGRDYLLSTYGKRSRLHLTDDELLEFWHYLEALPN